MILSSYSRLLHIFILEFCFGSSTIDLPREQFGCDIQFGTERKALRRPSALALDPYG